MRRRAPVAAPAVFSREAAFLCSTTFFPFFSLAFAVLQPVFHSARIERSRSTQRRLPASRDATAFSPSVAAQMNACATPFCLPSARKSRALPTRLPPFPPYSRCMAGAPPPRIPLRLALQVAHARRARSQSRSPHPAHP
eukprot:6184365-Pleurochrysis_carterae.AAC.1